MNPVLLGILTDTLLTLVKKQFGDAVPSHIVAALLARVPAIILVSGDLMDGDGKLNTESMNALSELVLDVRAGRIV